MKVLDKICAKENDRYGKAPVTLAFLGDSVTQGCFEVYRNGERSVETVFDYKSAYSTRLSEILHILYPSAQINVVNSGISGGWAIDGYNRVDRDIVKYNPDLTVVGFALNDSTLGVEKIEEYADALDKIFKKIKTVCPEIIFLTPNFMCTKTSVHVTDDFEKELSVAFAGIQNNGTLDAYVARAKEVCAENGVVVCDIYSAWKKMQKYGVDTTELLANKLNHPIRDLHYYTAVKLLETMMDN